MEVPHCLLPPPCLLPPSPLPALAPPPACRPTSLPCLAPLRTHSPVQRGPLHREIDWDHRWVIELVARPLDMADLLRCRHA